MSWTAPGPQSSSPAPRSGAARADIYGISRNLLDDAGPSVVSINGAVASLAGAAGVTVFG